MVDEPVQLGNELSIRIPGLSQGLFISDFQNVRSTDFSYAWLQVRMRHRSEVPIRHRISRNYLHRRD